MPATRHRSVTTLNLEGVEGDAERGLLLIRGAVPGPREASCSSATPEGRVAPRQPPPGRRGAVRSAHDRVSPTPVGAARRVPVKVDVLTSRHKHGNADLPDTSSESSERRRPSQVVTPAGPPTRGPTRSKPGQSPAAVRSHGARRHGSGPSGLDRSPSGAAEVSPGQAARLFAAPPKKMVRLALRSALSDRRRGRGEVITAWEIDEPKTPSGPGAPGPRPA